MYVYHAWLELRVNTEDEDLGELRQKSDILRKIARDKLNIFEQDPVVDINYVTTFQCFSSHNHLTDAHERLIYVLDWVCKELPGSFGVIYWQDDEAEGWDSFQGFNVIVMKRGKLFHKLDTFFSPRKEIED